MDGLRSCLDCGISVIVVTNTKYCLSCSGNRRILRSRLKDKKRSHDKRRSQKKRHRSKAGNRNLINSFKASPCMDCGVQYPPYVMDSDHPNDDKKFNVSQMTRATKAQIMAEIAKCDLVCSNCHRQRTFQRRLV